MTESQQKRDQLRQLANQAKEKGCQIPGCNENRIPCLSFHHKDPNDKCRDISYMVSKKYSVRQLLEEISKCVVICHCCHALVEAGWIDLQGNKTELHQ